MRLKESRFGFLLFAARIAHVGSLSVACLYTGPASKNSFIALIRSAIQKGICVVASSQCLRGSVSLATYEVGRMLIELVSKPLLPLLLLLLLLLLQT